jgi:hypothetical protein
MMIYSFVKKKKKKAEISDLPEGTKF